MSEDTEWHWRFLGFRSDIDGEPVQKWFDSLKDNDRYEIADQLLWISNQTRSQWRRPNFDPLDGEGGISEIIIPDIRTEAGVAYYRIYGFFGPIRYKHSYTLLHGTDKEERNDEYGKEIAKDRFRRIERGEATVHEFRFESEFGSQVEEGTGSKSPVC